MDPFDGLAAYLGRMNARSCTLPFSTVEELTGRPLPPAAANAAWWRSRGGDPDAPGWTCAGWRVEAVWSASRQVRFVRTDETMDGRPSGDGSAVGGRRAG